MDVAELFTHGLEAMVELVTGILEAIAWPAAIVVIGCMFKKPLSELLAGIIRIKYRGFEVELEKNTVTTNPESNTIIAYLDASAHSFQWFRDNTAFNWSDDRFEQFVRENSELVKSVAIVNRDPKVRQSDPGLPGMKLKPEARKRLEYDRKRLEDD